MIVPVVAALGFINVESTRRVSDNFSQVVDHNLPAVIALNQIKTSAFQLLHEASHTDDFDTSDLSPIWQVLRTDLSIYLTQSQNPEREAIYATLDQISHDLYEAGRDMTQGSNRITTEEIDMYAEDLLTTIDAAINAELTAVANHNRLAQDTAWYVVVANLTLIALIFVLTMLVGLVMARHIAAPIVALDKATCAYGAGRLDIRSNIQRNDEIGALAQSFDTMAEQINELFDNLENRYVELTTQKTQIEANQRTLEVILAVNKYSDPAELLSQVVDLIRIQFNLHAVQLYLYNKAKTHLVLHEKSGLSEVSVTEIPIESPSLLTLAVREQETSIEHRSGHTMLVVPLRYGRRMIGALNLQYKTAYSLSISNISLYETIANQVALLYENSKLLKETMEQSDRLTYFAQRLQIAAHIARHVSTILSRDDLPPYIVETVREQFNFQYVALYLYTKALVLEAEAGRRDNPPDIQFLMQAAEQQETVTIEEAAPFTGAVVPLILKKASLGVICVHAPAIHTTDLDTLKILCGQIASALENARLFAESEQTAERLREVDRLKNEFLGTVSHELRTPLNAILGYSEGLLLGIEGDLSEAVQRDLQAVYKSGKRLLNIVNDILDLAGIQARRFNLDKVKIPAETVLKDVHTENIELFNHKPIDFIVNVEYNLPWIEADPIRVKQILNNLISNAVKFTQKGYVKVWTHQEDDWLCFTVQDTGIGIAKDDMSLIFEEFRQVDGSLTRTAEGMGVGLTLARALVHLHNGEIIVKSVPDKGTTVVVRLPILADPLAIPYPNNV